MTHQRCRDDTRSSTSGIGCSYVFFRFKKMLKLSGLGLILKGAASKNTRGQMSYWSVVNGRSWQPFYQALTDIIVI